MDVYIVLLDEQSGKFDSKLTEDPNVVLCHLMIVIEEGVDPFKHLEDAVSHEHDSLAVVVGADEVDGLDDASAAFFRLEGVVDGLKGYLDDAMLL